MWVTHACLTAICLGLPGWAGTRKVIWILLKQETVSRSGISWAVCKSAPRSRQITMPTPHHSVFYRLDALPAAQPTASKHWRHWNVSKGWENRIMTDCNKCHTTSHGQNKRIYAKISFDLSNILQWKSVWNFSFISFMVRLCHQQHSTNSHIVSLPALSGGSQCFRNDVIIHKLFTFEQCVVRYSQKYIYNFSSVLFWILRTAVKIRNLAKWQQVP